MPYIQLNISKKITNKQKDAIKKSIGHHISILPDKSEQVLMVTVLDDMNIFFRGVKENCAFLDVKIYKTSPQDKKGEFSRAVIGDLNSIIEIDKKNVFICFGEYNSWFSNGEII